MTYNKNTLIGQLSRGVCEVQFIKHNGEQRTMRCTLQESRIPKSQAKTFKQTDKEDNIIVWDVDKDDWRQFNISSILPNGFR